MPSAPDPAFGTWNAVDSGQTAQYVYNALGQRVQATVGGTVTGYLFNSAGQRVSEWNGTLELKGKYYWGARPVAYYAGGATHFEQQDWLGTERMRTTYNGTVEGTFTSLPFGDGQATSGADTDANHYAQLDHDWETGTDHAQFRQYSEAQGRWLSPDSYSGSYNMSNPQSFNRYIYAGNNPLAAVDPTGEYLVDCSWDICRSDATVDGAPETVFTGLGSYMLAACPNNVCSGFSSSGQYGQFYAFAGGTQGYYAPGDLSDGINEVDGHLLTNDQYNAYVQAVYSDQIDDQKRALAQHMADASGGQICYEEAYNNLKLEGGYLNGGNYNFATTYGPDDINCSSTRCDGGIHFPGSGLVHLDTANPYGGVGGLFEHFFVDVFLGNVYYNVIPRP